MIMLSLSSVSLLFVHFISASDSFFGEFPDLDNNFGGLSNFDFGAYPLFPIEPAQPQFKVVTSPKTPFGVVPCNEPKSDPSSPTIFGLIRFKLIDSEINNNIGMMTLKTALSHLCTFPSVAEATKDFAASLVVVERHMSSLVHSACMIAYCEEKKSLAVFVIGQEFDAAWSSAGLGGNVTGNFRLFKQQSGDADMIYAVAPTATSKSLLNQSKSNIKQVLEASRNVYIYGHY